MDSVHHIWCPLFSQEFQDLPDGAETTLTMDMQKLTKETISLLPKEQQKIATAKLNALESRSR